jgi:hypothetical protein
MADVFSSECFLLHRSGHPLLCSCLPLAETLPCWPGCAIDFLVDFYCREEAGLTHELPDRKARGFRVPITLKWLFPVHARKLFGEMSVRT